MLKRKVTGRRALVVCAALASMSLVAPSSARASGGYDVRCDMRVRSYCGVNWETDGYEYFQSCLDDLLPMCYLP